MAAAMKTNDLNTVQAEKSLIENRQRELRKTEKEGGKEWERIFFNRVEKYPHFETLANKIGENIDAEKTNGVWAFDETKAKTVKPPFRPGAMP